MGSAAPAGPSYLTPMAAVGCLLPFVLLIVGAVIGGVIGGTPAGLWGAGIGAGVGLAAMLAALRWFDRTRTNWPE